MPRFELCHPLVKHRNHSDAPLPPWLRYNACRRLARMRLFVLGLVTVFSLSTATGVFAADGQAAAAHAVSPAALDAAMQQHTAATAADRDAVLRVLDHAQVKEVAGKMGV